MPTSWPCRTTLRSPAVQATYVVIKFETHSPDGLAADPTIVFLSWPYAKRLALALSEFVNSYEKAVGQIPLLDKLPIDAGKEGVQQAAATLEEMPRDE